MRKYVCYVCIKYIIYDYGGIIQTSVNRLFNESWFPFDALARIPYIIIHPQG